MGSEMCIRDRYLYLSANQDYVSNMSTLMFEPRRAGSQSLVINVMDDILLESTETFFIILRNVSEGTVVIGTDTATINILDNDGKLLASYYTAI